MNIKYPKHSKIPDKLLKITENFIKNKERRYFGQAAIGLKNQLVDPKYKDLEIDRRLVQAGIEGEIATSNILRKWIYDKPECVLIDSIHLPLDISSEEENVNELGDTDHLVILGHYLIVIDSKNWKEKASYSVTESGEILRSKKEFKGNKPHIKQMKYLWKKFYEELNKPLEIDTYICISNPNSFITRDRNWWLHGFKLVNQETLVYFLDKFYNEQITEEDKFIDIELVAKAITGLQKPYNVYKEKFPTMYQRVNGG